MTPIVAADIITEVFTAPRFPAATAMAAWFAGALLMTAFGTFWLLRSNAKVGVDAPDKRRKFHEKPILRLGGAPIYLALMTGILVGIRLGYLEWSRWMPLVVCNSMMFAVGFADDLKPLGAKVKLLGQIVAALTLYGLGVSIDILSNPFGEGGLALGWWWSVLLTLLWLVAIPNIINLIDGMDGLASGFGLFLALTLGFVGYHSQQGDIVVASLVMAGALGGFLIFNFPPAKIFLGDGGAYLIGFFIASVSLKSSNKGSVIAALLVVVIALGVPILDTAFAILRRAIRGVPIFSADAEHIHHRLILLGWSKSRALVAMYTVCLVLSLIGISILLTKGIALPITGAILFLMALGAARYLGYVRSWSNLRQQINQALDSRRWLEHARAHARVLEFDVEKCESLEEFAEVVQHRLRWVGFLHGYGPGVTPIELVLFDGTTCQLYRPSRSGTADHWNRRADAFVPVFDRCLALWGKLPAFLVPSPPKAPPVHQPAPTV